MACARSPRDFRLNAKTAETCENRRLPLTTQSDAALWAGCKRIEATGEYIALRRFREPPVLIFLGGTSDEANVARAAGDVPKRLPSGRWAIGHHMNERDPPGRRGRKEPKLAPVGLHRIFENVRRDLQPIYLPTEAFQSGEQGDLVGSDAETGGAGEREIL